MSSQSCANDDTEAAANKAHRHRLLPMSNNAPATAPTERAADQTRPAVRPVIGRDRKAHKQKTFGMLSATSRDQVERQSHLHDTKCALQLKNMTVMPTKEHRISARADGHTAKASRPDRRTDAVHPTKGCSLHVPSS